MLTEIDDLEIHVIVNDELDPISPSPNAAVKVASRFMGIPLSPLEPGAERGGATMEMRMDNICCAAHGISLLLIASKGNKKHYLLFDAGPEGQVWERNSRRLRTNTGQIEHIALSHYHRDHSGGLIRAIELIKGANGGKPVYMDVHPNRPAFRGVQADRPISLEADPSFEELEAARATLIKSDQPHTVLDAFFLVSGEVPRQTTYEDGIYGGLRFNSSTGQWEEDTLIMDERYVMCNLKDKGLVVFTGCGHAGVVNTCHDAVKLGNGIPLYCVVGGYHLADAEDSKLNATMEDLKKFDPKVLLAGHCTGWSSRGLGLELVKQSAAHAAIQGGLVIAAARKCSAKLDDIIAQGNGSVVFVPLDISDEESIMQSAKKVISLLQGRTLDILINCAGVHSETEGKLANMSDLAYQLSVNVIGTHNVLREFLPLMKDGLVKKVANISSAFGSITNARDVTYAACPAYKISKAALNALIVQYALSYQDDGFTIIAVHPGWLQTDMGGENADLIVPEGGKVVLDLVMSVDSTSNGCFKNIKVPGWAAYDGGDIPCDHMIFYDYCIGEAVDMSAVSRFFPSRRNWTSLLSTVPTHAHDPALDFVTDYVPGFSNVRGHSPGDVFDVQIAQMPVLSVNVCAVGDLPGRDDCRGNAKQPRGSASTTGADGTNYHAIQAKDIIQLELDDGRYISHDRQCILKSALQLVSEIAETEYRQPDRAVDQEILHEDSAVSIPEVPPRELLFMLLPSIDTYKSLYSRQELIASRSIATCTHPALLMQHLGRISQCWILISYAARQIVSLNYHKVRKTHGQSHMEQEIYSIVYWCFYLDRTLSALLFRPPSLPDLKVPPTELIKLHPSSPYDTLIHILLDLAQIQGKLHTISCCGNHGSNRQILEICEILEGQMKSIVPNLQSGRGSLPRVVQYDWVATDFCFYAIFVEIHRTRLKASFSPLIHKECLLFARKSLKAFRFLQQHTGEMAGFDDPYPSFLTWTLFLYPLSPFFVVFCNIIGTLDLADYNLMRQITDALSQFRRDPHIERLLTLLHALERLCDPLFQDQGHEASVTERVPAEVDTRFAGAVNNGLPDSENTTDSLHFIGGMGGNVVPGNAPTQDSELESSTDWLMWQLFNSQVPAGWMNWDATPFDFD
ncbi:hypothetical protein FE257_000104 [Aspergillus nanangensis]|uniref:Xylanolytic transcriptional activator regulatory domain-containing protein n=1 Tax=Aspergillus nanangensis TaxID=2582783 RepID=A0AAD4D0R7_ASPNN|nr:hypothetical protein FE257_000104 [Aspergillus nanangensis]